MQNKLLAKKLKEFKKYVEKFLMHKKHNVEDIHTLRVNSRELCSIISVDDPFYSRVKRVIKLSNKIRDMDVFLEVYLDSLPKKYRLQLDLNDIKESVKKKRKKKTAKLHTYVQSIVIPESALSHELIHKPSSNISQKTPYLKQTELHKYRIYIKKQLYNEKISTPVNMKKIKALTKIKNLLGTINDNYNGLKSLGNFSIKPKLYDKVQDYTEKENLKIYIKFKEIDLYYKTHDLKTERAL